jgi:two-component system chemotaxis response regulator CheV
MSTAVGNILLDKEILLESGTNELEMLVFEAAGFTFGINVAKVREVLPAMPITNLPKAHPSIRGVFKLRNRVIPCVSLFEHLGIERRDAESESMMILTDFNQQQTAFLVDKIERIHRLSWENILSVPGLVALSQTPMTAVARCGERMIVMLDFEMIIDQVTSRYFREDAVPNPRNLPRHELRLLLADDSPTVREAVGNTLRASGYKQLTFFENGAAAWKHIQERFAVAGRVEDVGDLLISDVEMPQIDGFHLTKRIKEHAELRRLPVLLYSSIVTPDNHKKGQAVGADAQVSKPELHKVVELADALIFASREKVESKESPLEVAVPVAAVSSKVESRTPTPAPAAPAPQVSTASIRTPVQNQARRESRPTSSNVSAPAGIDPSLWQTFHQELRDRVAHLGDLVQAAHAAPVDGTMLNEMFRTLHTIKSAAMVVPADAVAHLTHLAESLLEPARKEPALWPHAGLKLYLDWLCELVAASRNPDRILARAIEVERRLTAQLATV